MLIFALLLPWIAGSLWLLWLESFSPRLTGFNIPRILGYGFFLGNFFCASLLFLAHFLFGQLSFTAVSAMLLFLSCVGFLLAWQRTGYGRISIRFSLPAMGDSGRKLALLIAVLMAVHLLFAGYDALNRPLLPWDAWTTWTYRAKIWFQSQDLSSFVDAAAWLGTTAADTYTIPAHDYPLTVSLIQLWPSLAAGTWDDRLAAVPGLFAGFALVLALYGQARSLKHSALLALAGGYLLISIPLLDAHLALPGYADIWLSGFAGLGFVSLLQWSQSKDRTQLFTGLLFLLLGFFIKREGSLWLMTGLLFALIQGLPLKLLAALILAMILAVFSGFSLVDLPGLGRLGYFDGAFYLPGVDTIRLQPQDASLAVLNNLFTNSSWNLLFYYVSTMLLLQFLPLSRRVRRALLSFVLLISLIIAVIFLLSSNGRWLRDSTAFSRLLLQVPPPLVFVLLIAWRTVFPPRKESQESSK
ncbi:hypothetical protein [Thiolapillus sp.]|uniref:hypothetical protein n=3 Tax=Thiolapillus sp. TaxID=2017437 RepID=UPI003AF6FF1B